MKIGLYNPYLTSVMGGGERHFLSIAQALSRQHHIDIILPQPQPKLLLDLKKTFHLDLSKINFISLGFFTKSSLIKKINFTKQYDIFYYMTDGSFFISRAKKNIVHFQVPFNHPPNLIQRLKLKSWDIITANSKFTKNWLEKNWKIKINYVHKGSIDTNHLKPGKKQNIILSVGRFISDKNNKHCKRQDFLVSTFIKMCQQGLTGWKLVLIGNLETGPDNHQFAHQVKSLAKNYPIIIKHNSNFHQLAKAYSTAKIYWHAAGYGVDQTINPQAVEHLGLTTAEAQSSGTVPVVINKGGQPEVVTHNLNGLLWNTQDELISQSLQLIKSPGKLKKLSTAAIINSQKFSEDKFYQLTKKIFTL